MSTLPLIIGLGGVNPAGRVSADHAFRRIVIDALGSGDAADTYASLVGLMALEGDPADEATRRYIRDHTLIRRIEAFDPADITVHRAATIGATGDGALQFLVPRRHLPESPPADWAVKPRADGSMEVSVPQGADVLFPDRRVSRVTSAGQAPTGFDPGRLYQSRNPRGW